MNITAKMIKTRSEWNDLFWLIADNDVQKYNEIRRLEVSEFFTYLEKWKEGVEKKLKNLKNG